MADRIETVRTVVAASKPNVELMKENPQSRLPTLRLAVGTVIYNSIGDLRVSRCCPAAEAVSEGLSRAADGAAPSALGDGMLDTMLMWRGEVLRPPAQQSIKHMQAWKLKTNVSVDTLEEEADALFGSPFSIGHIAIGSRSATSISAFPSLLAQRPPAADQVV